MRSDFGNEKSEAPDTAGDYDVYQGNLALADLAEPMGFDSLWSVEHHFTGYTMVPDLLQVLSYMAARTRTIRLGTQCLILPWHNPARLAESIALFDNLAPGRLVLGFGRGLGRIEFEGLGVPMGESRDRFVEYSQLILNALERGYLEQDTPLVRQPKRWLRPAPTHTFKGRTYAAAVSPESLKVVAKLGMGLLIAPQKPWKTTIAEIEDYRNEYAKHHHDPPPQPIIACPLYCDESEDRAAEMGVRYIGQYYTNLLKHYELKGSHFEQTRNYEYYEQISRQLNSHETSQSERFFADLQVYGTPDQCIDKVAAIKEMTGCSEFIAYFSYSGLAQHDVQGSLELFHDKVQPKLRTF